MTALLGFEQVAGVRGGRLLFDQLSFELAPGEALLVSGPNGSGKSSLLRIAAGLLRPASGRVWSSGARSLADGGTALDRRLPLADALRFWARLDGAAARLGAALDAFALARLAEVPVRFLSTGQLQRARLARVVASGARLWLLDEPLNGLDVAGVRLLGAAIERHRSDGGAVVAASHGPLAGEWRQLVLGQ